MGVWSTRLLWAAFSLLIAAEVLGFATTGILSQTIWTAPGLTRLAWFAAVYGAWAGAAARWRPRWCSCVLLGTLLLWTAVAVGIIPVLAVLLFLFSSWRLGRLFIAGELLAVFLGVGIYSFVEGLIVHFPINYSATALLLLLLPLAFHPRSSLEALSKVGVVLGELSAIDSKLQLALASVGFPLAANWLIALKPEVSTDGLAMHLVIPAAVAQHHLWGFDFHDAFWAFMPMGGDWIYTLMYLLGGEAAARLVNLAFLVLITALTFGVIRRCLPLGGTAILTALFVSTPLVQLVTGSLFVENFWGAMILGAFVALWQFRETRQVRMLYVFAVLLGVALSSKFAALPFVGIFIVIACWGAWRIPRMLAAAGLLVAFGIHPYLVAFLKTGNPVFPFLNNIFHSPYMESAWRFTDVRFEVPLQWRTIYDVTFHTGRFLESQDGAAGFQYLLLLPLGLIALRRSTARLAWIALLSSVLAVWMTFLLQSNLRYCYAAMPIATIGFGAVLSLYRTSQRNFYRAVMVVCGVLVPVNMYFASSSGGIHKDFWLNPFDARERTAYVDLHAPARNLIAYLNRTAPGQPVGFIGTNQIAGLQAQALTATWHHKFFGDALDNATSPYEVLKAVNRFGVEYFIAPGLDSNAVLLPAFAPFLGAFAEAESQSGPFYVWKLKPEFSGVSGVERARQTTMADVVKMWRSRSASSVKTAGEASPQGDYDDRDPGIVWYGPWIHDTQYPLAFRGSLGYSNVIGTTAEFVFSGTEITYVFSKSFNRGKALVSIDDAPGEVMDLYGPGIEWQSRRTWKGLAFGTHTFRISVLPEKNFASQGFYVDVDGLLVR